MSDRLTNGRRSQGFLRPPYSGAALALYLISGAVIAGQFEFTPSVTLRAAYTDNVNLAPSGEEDDEYIGAITPGFVADYRSRRMNGRATYRMQNFFYANDSSRNRTTNNLEARGVGELVEEALFVDATATALQSVIDPANGVPSDNAIASGNLTDTYTGTVSPYYRARLGDFGRAELRYGRGVVLYDDSALADSDLYSFSGRMESLPSADRVSWAVDGRSDRVTYDDDTENIKLRNVLGELGYRVGRYTELLALGGYENNNFEVLPEYDDPQGPIWAVGFRYSRAGRYQLEALAGRRFFGNTYRLLWTQTAPRFSTSAEYRDELVTTSIAQLERTLPDDPVSSLPRTALYSLGREVYLRKRGTAVATLILPKTSLALRGFWEKREPATSIGNERLRGGDLTFRWRLGSRTEFFASAGVQWNELADVEGEDRLDIGRLGLERQMSPRISAGIDARYNNRNADDPDREYTERAAGVRLTATF